MKAISLGSAVSRVSYPGCGMIAGKSADGNSAVAAYFIMGRTPLSKNRLFIEDGGGVTIQPFIESVARNMDALLYAPVLAFENKLVMGNGAHTEDLYKALLNGSSFEESVTKQDFLKDAPHFTPRITSLVSMDGSDFNLRMSIVKRMDEAGQSAGRYIFDYTNVPAGTGYYMHTFDCDASVLPSFSGEPIPVTVNGSIFDMVADIWENLNAENKVSLWVRTIDLYSHKSMSRIINNNR